MEAIHLVSTTKFCEYRFLITEEANYRWGNAIRLHTSANGSPTLIQTRMQTSVYPLSQVFIVVCWHSGRMRNFNLHIELLGSFM